MIYWFDLMGRRTLRSILCACEEASFVPELGTQSESAVVHIRSSLLRNTSLNAKALFSSTYGCHFSQRRCEELASPLPRHSHALRRHGPCSSGTKESFHIHPLFSCRGRKGVFFFLFFFSPYFMVGVGFMSRCSGVNAKARHCARVRAAPPLALSFHTSTSASRALAWQCGGLACSVWLCLLHVIGIWVSQFRGQV